MTNPNQSPQFCESGFPISSSCIIPWFEYTNHILVFRSPSVFPHSSDRRFSALTGGPEDASCGDRCCSIQLHPMIAPKSFSTAPRSQTATSQGLNRNLQIPAPYRGKTVTLYNIPQQISPSIKASLPDFTQISGFPRLVPTLSPR